MHVGIANPRWRENVPGIPGACATGNFAYLVRGCRWEINQRVTDLSRRKFAEKLLGYIYIASYDHISFSVIVIVCLADVHGIHRDWINNLLTFSNASKVLTGVHARGMQYYMRILIFHSIFQREFGSGEDSYANALGEIPWDSLKHIYFMSL